MPVGSAEKDWPVGDARAALERRALEPGVRGSRTTLTPGSRRQALEVAALAGLAVGVAARVDRARVGGSCSCDGVAEQRVLDRVDRGRRWRARTAPKLRQRVLLLERRDLDLDALHGAGRVLVGDVVGEVRPHVREVVADRDVRADVAQRRVQRASSCRSGRRA